MQTLRRQCLHNSRAVVSPPAHLLRPCTGNGRTLYHSKATQHQPDLRGFTILEHASLYAPPTRSRAVQLVRAAGPPQHQQGDSKARLAIFVSGGGSNFKAIHKACQEGRINADVSVVISDVPSCGGVEYAKAHGIHTLTFPIPKKGGLPGLSTQELVNALTQQADYVLLAGFLKLVPGAVVRQFKRRMLNVHPGLLPAFGGKGFYGERVHRAVLESGARFSGPTVHFVDEEYDTGPILAQAVVPVLPTDTPHQLAARVLTQEHIVYPTAVAALVDGRITWRDDGVPILWSAH